MIYLYWILGTIVWLSAGYLGFGLDNKSYTRLGLGYFSVTKYLIFVLLGPVNLLASLAQAGRIDFDFHIKTRLERYKIFCKIYGDDYRTFNQFNKEY